MKKNNSDSHKLTIDRFEEDTAILSDGQFEYKIPKKILPGDTSLGQSVILKLTSEAEDTKIKDKTAKEILNEILQGQ